jgi:hypothetical protein
MQIKCACCGCQVTDSINGEVSPAAPWAPDASETAYCYACDNVAMDGAESQQMLASVRAAQRAGRFDLV